MNTFPELRDGDELEPFHINLIFKELKRWSRFKAAPPLDLNGMEGDGPPVLSAAILAPIFIKLTGSYDMTSSSYPWKEVVVGTNYTVTDTGMTGSGAAGDGAFERQTGDTTLTAGDTIYEGRRSPASGAGWYFDGKN